jgi:hypothetical protein
VIKRIRFASRRSGVSADELVAGWRAAAGGAAEAPVDVRPLRSTVSISLPEVTELAPVHDAVGFEWFTDPAHLDRYTRWFDTFEGQSAESQLARLVQPSSRIIVAEEKVVRGVDWLAQWWRGDGEVFKHMAVAVRAVGMTPAEFSLAWSGHAGTVSSAGTDKPAAIVVIPAEVRGEAYVQNHPLLTGTWAYDAVNEVYFNDVADLERRIAWFADNMDQAAQQHLFSRSWFIAAREEVLFSGLA